METISTPVARTRLRPETYRRPSCGATTTFFPGIASIRPRETDTMHKMLTLGSWHSDRLRAISSVCGDPAVRVWCRISRSARDSQSRL